MSELNQKAVKIMSACLQRQRNAAMDRQVDLEVSVEMQATRIKELEEELVSCYATVNAMRDINTKLKCELEECKNSLTLKQETEAQPVIEYSNSDSASQNTQPIVESTSDFEEAVISKDHFANDKSASKIGFFKAAKQGKHGK